jgi:hypothetical protein
MKETRIRKLSKSERKQRTKKKQRDHNESNHCEMTEKQMSA